MAVPYTFANASVSIPLSQLDSNFGTTITFGNTSIQLGNTVTTLNNMTLVNVTVSSGNATFTNVTVTNSTLTNVTISGGTANALVYTNANIRSLITTFPNNFLSNSSTTLGNTVLTLGGTSANLGNINLANATISSLSAPLATISGGTGANSIANASIVTYAGSETLTNKRINPRVSTAANATTLTPDISAFDQYNLTAQDKALTVAAPIGTPVDGNKLLIRITGNSSAFAITWNATYTTIGVSLPTTTVAAKTVYIGSIYNATNTRWDVVAVTTQV
jgi:hypothetical protein